MPTTSRFPDAARSFLAGWYKLLHPTPAFHVDLMTPSQIAGTLGLDEMSAISAVPFEARPLPPRRDTTGDGDRPPRRVRQIVRGV